MKKTRLLWEIIKINNVDKIVITYLMFFFITAVVVRVVEPGINGWGDGIWFCFAIMTTIGFGDLVAVTFVGRLFSILLGIYSLFIVALVPGIMVNYFQEKTKIKEKESIVMFLHQLERLPELSKEELTDLSERAKSKISKFKNK